MGHSIQFYQSDPDAFDRGPTPQFMLNGCLLTFSTISLFVAPWYSLGAMFLFFFNIIMWWTSEQMSMERDQISTWKKYKSLSPENRNKIPLTSKTLTNLGGESTRQISRKIDSLAALEVEKKRLAGVTIGDFTDIIDALNEAVKDESNEIDFLKETHKELQERGLV